MKISITKLLTLTTIALLAYSNLATAQWKKMTSPSGTSPINCIISLGNNIVAGLSNNAQGIRLSTDDGTSWMPVNKGLPNSPTVLSFATIDQTIFAVVGTGNNMFGSIFNSSDYGISWTKKVSTIANMDSCTEIVAAGSDLYAAIKNGSGIYKSIDWGTTWVQVGQGIAKAGPLLVSGSAIYAGLSGSNDDGATWKVLPGPVAMISSLAVIGSILYGGDVSGKGVFHSSDNGADWYRDSVGLKGQAVLQMVAIGPKLFVGTNGGGLFRSDNQGLNWVSDNKGIALVSTVSMCFGRSTTDIYWASNDGSVYKKSLLTGVEELNLIEHLTVYPNPSLGKFKIGSEPYNQNSSIEVFNLLGERIFIQQNLNDIDLTESPKGIYLAKIKIGACFGIKKLILQ